MTTHRLTRPHGHLTFDRTGTGRPVVCAPGIGDTRTTWAPLAKILEAAGYRVYSLDLRGHGESDSTFPTYTPEDIGDDLVALLETEDLTNAVLVGNSISGAAVCHAALKAPERVGRLVLVNPFVRDMPVDRWMRPLVPLLFARPWGAWMWATYMKTLFIDRNPDAMAHYAEAVAAIRQVGHLVALRAMMRATKSGISARLGELRIPALVMMGSNDPDYTDPAAEGEVVKELLGGATEVAVIDGTGHYPQVERPEDVARHVILFLDGEARHGT